MGNNYSGFKSERNPVDSVSRPDCESFCDKLAARAAVLIRLPSEAEWEHACRAGTSTEYSFGNHEAELPQYAWFDGNSDKKSHPVGLKKPNPWGLYDIHGNVQEWCSGAEGVRRGGSWGHGDVGCRASVRDTNLHPSWVVNHGFRVVCWVGGSR